MCGSGNTSPGDWSSAGPCTVPGGDTDDPGGIPLPSADGGFSWGGVAGRGSEPESAVRNSSARGGLLPSTLAPLCGAATDEKAGTADDRYSAAGGAVVKTRSLVTVIGEESGGDPGGVPLPSADGWFFCGGVAGRGSEPESAVRESSVGGGLLPSTLSPLCGAATDETAGTVDNRYSAAGGAGVTGRRVVMVIGEESDCSVARSSEGWLVGSLALSVAAVMGGGSAHGMVGTKIVVASVGAHGASGSSGTLGKTCRGAIGGVVARVAVSLGGDNHCGVTKTDASVAGGFGDIAADTSASTGNSNCREPTTSDEALPVSLMRRSLAASACQRHRTRWCKARRSGSGSPPFSVPLAFSLRVCWSRTHRSRRAADRAGIEDGPRRLLTPERTGRGD